MALALGCRGIIGNMPCFTQGDTGSIPVGDRVFVP